MSRMLVTIFNDADADHSRSLESAIYAIPEISKLKYPPKVHHFEVGQDIANLLGRVCLVPTLFFVDPWGYKGLSLELIRSVLRNWGCDCIFFFNYNRINMGLSNTLVREHMNALFGETRADALRAQLEVMEPSEREMAIVEELAQALKDMGGNYVLPFRFVDAYGTRTSHHLVFVSKNVLGYTIMKEIMAAESSRTEQGVPALEYNPVDARYPLLFELSRPLDDLADILVAEFAGQTLTMQDVFERHQVGQRFIEKNYKDALRTLEEQGRITVHPPVCDRPRRNNQVTFASRVRVTFPPL